MTTQWVNFRQPFHMCKSSLLKGCDLTNYFLVKGNMLTNSRNESVAGTWGLEKLQQIPAGNRPTGQTSEMYATAASSTFNRSAFNLEKERAQNKYHKFKTLQQSGSQIIQYHPDSEQVDFNADTTFNGPVVEENPKFDHTQRRTSFSNKGDCPNVQRTNATLLRTADCPVAVGRSGLRKEMGVSTSGLLGERLSLHEDPKKNSLAQRSWLYNPDPALNYKIKGVPVAEMPNDVSLAIGGEFSGEKFAGWTYGRKAVLTGDILSASGQMRAGIFLDDY